MEAALQRVPHRRQSARGPQFGIGPRRGNGGMTGNRPEHRLGFYDLAGTLLGFGKKAVEREARRLPGASGLFGLISIISA